MISANDFTILYLSTSRADRLELASAISDSVDNPIIGCDSRAALEHALAARRGAALVILIDG